MFNAVVLKQTLWLLLLFASINNAVGQNNFETRVVKINSFPRTEHIKGESHNIMVRPNYIDVIGSKLILVERGRSPIFTVYSTPELERIGRFGRYGKGPGEFLKGIRYTYQYQRTENGIAFWVFGLNDRKLKLINLNESLKGVVKIERELKIPRVMPLEYNLFYINDEMMAGTSTYQVKSHYNQKRNKPLGGHFFVMNPITSEVKWFKPDPEIPYSGYKSMGSVYSDSPKIKPDGSLIAAPNKFFSKIDIYRTNGDRVITIKLPSPDNELVLPGPSTEHWFEGHYYYYGCFVTDKYIYAHYVNVKGRDHYDSKHKSQIHVFDWSGNPICLYKTDTAMDYIAVDEANGIIYGGHDITEGDLTVFRLRHEQRLK